MPPDGGLIENFKRYTMRYFLFLVLTFAGCTSGGQNENVVTPAAPDTLNLQTGNPPHNQPDRSRVDPSITDTTVAR
jgi:hypothetical protein